MVAENLRVFRGYGFPGNVRNLRRGLRGNKNEGKIWGNLKQFSGIRKWWLEILELESEIRKLEIRKIRK